MKLYDTAPVAPHGSGVTDDHANDGGVVSTVRGRVFWVAFAAPSLAVVRTW